MKLVGWILVFASLLGAIWLGSSLLVFIDFPSMLLILGVSSGVVLSRHSLPSIRIGIRAIGHRPTDVEEQQTAAAVLGSARIVRANIGGFIRAAAAMVSFYPRLASFKSYKIWLFNGGSIGDWASHGWIGSLKAALLLSQPAGQTY